MVVIKHARQQIREEFANLLCDLPSIGTNRVHVGRPYPLTDDEVPGIFIVTAAEESAPDTIGAVKLERTVNVVVLAFADGAGVVDLLDRIAVEVEQVIGAAISDKSSDLRGIAKDAQLRQTNVSIEGEGKARNGSIALTFAVDYRTARAVPQTALP